MNIIDLKVGNLFKYSKDSDYNLLLSIEDYDDHYKRLKIVLMDGAIDSIILGAKMIVYF